MNKFLALCAIVGVTASLLYFTIPTPDIVLGAAITPVNGRTTFVADWDPDTYWELNSTNLGTNYGDDATGFVDNTAVGSGDISTQEGYEGMNNQNDPPPGSDFDNNLTNDAALLVYIPAGLTHSTVRGLWSNGGGTNGQGMFLRATASGVELACGHNNGGDLGDYLIEEIPDADLPGWFVFSCEFNSYGGSEGDMALWLNGTAVRSGTRVYTLDWGPGDPDFGNNSAREPNASQVLDPVSYSGGDWGANNNINGTGILIANFTEDNPSGGASDTSPGNGDTWHTDYYADHHSAGAPSDSCTYSGSGDWTINSGDSCLIDSFQYVAGSVYLVNTGGGGLYLTGNGTLSVGGRIEGTSTSIYVGAGGVIDIGNG